MLKIILENKRSRLPFNEPARDAFSSEDLDLLSVLAGPAQVALSNARRFRDEQRRAAELAGLAHCPKGIARREIQKIYFFAWSKASFR